MFKPYIYSYVPGHDFGPAQAQTHRGPPLPCASYKAPNEDEKRWSDPSPKRVYLGPTAPNDGWHHDITPASILVMRGGETRDAGLHGYAVLDLWPLAGTRPVLKYEGRQHFVENVPQHPTPPPEVAGLLVGCALAGALDVHTRLAVEGPAWALDVLAALPGVVVFDSISSRCERGACTAWGRRWKINSWPSPYQVAQRLSGLNPHAFSGEHRAVGSLLVGKHPQRKRIVVTCEGADRWSIDGGDLGYLVIHEPSSRTYGEPRVRWPSAEDPWLRELVGDGEPIEVLA